MKIPYEDLISGDPIPYKNVCHVRSPYLRDLRPTTGIGYKRYNMYLSALSWTEGDMLDLMNGQTSFNVGGKPIVDLTRLSVFQWFSLMSLLPMQGGQQFGELLPEALNFFLVENCKWENQNHIRIKVFEGRDPDEEETEWKALQAVELEKKRRDPSYEVRDIPEPKKKRVTYIDEKNFEEIRGMIQQLNFINDDEEDTPKSFASAKAKELWEQAQKYLKKQKRVKKNNGEPDPAYNLGNIISKLCCASPSYNLTNVYDLTVYQLYDQYFQIGYLKVTNLSEMAYSHWGGKQFKMERWMQPYKRH